jgi:hypothetical protein
MLSNVFVFLVTERDATLIVIDNADANARL